MAAKLSVNLFLSSSVLSSPLVPLISCDQTHHFVVAFAR